MALWWAESIQFQPKWNRFQAPFEEAEVGGGWGGDGDDGDGDGSDDERNPLVVYAELAI